MDPIEWCSMTASLKKPTNPLLRNLMNGISSYTDELINPCPWKSSMGVSDVELNSHVVAWIPSGWYRDHFWSF
jgi:hypothetical protein